MNGMVTSLHFAPLVPLLWVWILGGVMVFLTGLSLRYFPRGVVGRAIMGLTLLSVLMNPSLLQEDRSATPNVAVIVVDRTMSQNFGERMARTDQALSSLRTQLEGRADIELRIVDVDNTNNNSGETQLFSSIEDAFMDVPKTQRAGVILLSDGQVHDVPHDVSDRSSAPQNFDDFGPIHAFISGEAGEYDRRIVVTNAPAYGIMGQNVSVHFRVEDSRSKASAALASVIVRHQDGREELLQVTIGEDYAFDVPITHAGQNVFEIITDTQKGELTALNNRNVVLVNGVRDRLKVLLVSGKPHIGERTWRNLLTSDPGVDLVHFTILREINKLDNTPQDELSLIPFPFQELFEVKLYDFDLIIFDNYRVSQILPNRYFENIVRYVREGGALLEASGHSYSDPNRSTYSTPLQQILPAAPEGQILDSQFFPSLTEKGEQHPVTRGLVWGNSGQAETQNWGPWFRQNKVRVQSGHILMRGHEKTPLLILDRVAQGRVAQFSSDNLWLWAKGYQNGGPHAELSRRIIHWLMKEPELDEEAMNVSVNGNDITIRMQNYEGNSQDIQMVRPDGEIVPLSLQDNQAGWFETIFHAQQSGIYSFENARGQRKFAVIGTLNPPEMRDVLSTDSVLRPTVNATGGKVIWLSRYETPEVRILETNKTRTRFGGRNWVGLQHNKSSIVTASRNITLIVPWIGVICLIGILSLMWWFEGRRR